MAYALKMGRRLIHDIERPQPHEIDLDHIEDVLWNLRRWSGHPRALTVRQHTVLTAALAEADGAAAGVVRWCRYHDDHEAVIGDIPGPLKAIISAKTAILARIERRLDEAICIARGISMPKDSEALAVHEYDKLSETLEWVFLFGHEFASWNRPIPQRWSHDVLRDAVHRAAALKREDASTFYLIQP